MFGDVLPRAWQAGIRDADGAYGHGCCCADKRMHGFGAALIWWLCSLPDVATREKCLKVKRLAPMNWLVVLGHLPKVGRTCSPPPQKKTA